MSREHQKPQAARKPPVRARGFAFAAQNEAHWRHRTTQHEISASPTACMYDMT